MNFSLPCRQKSLVRRQSVPNLAKLDSFASKQDLIRLGQALIRHRPRLIYDF
jgi:hypothetical protein